MLDSMRAQLTLWYTGILALVLIIFAALTYAYLDGAARQRTDASLADTANSFISSFVPELHDEDHTPDDVAQEAAREFGFSDRQVIIYDEARRVLAASDVPKHEKDKASWPSLSSLSTALDALLTSASQTGRSCGTLPGGRGGIRACAAPVRSGPKTYLIVIAQSLHEQEEALAQARHAFYLAIPLSLLIASLGGYFLARKSLAPVMAMGEQAARIGAANLHERLPVANERNELGRLAYIFNDLLARLDRSFEQQRRFMADASHELRTPVAIMRGESEVALSQPERDGEDYRESLAIVNDESWRLTRIVEDLFTLARADTGQYPLKFTNFYLNDMIGECLRAARSLSEQHGLKLCYQPADEEFPFHGDEALLARMCLNLLDNAIKYTPAGGSICVSFRKQGELFSITIADTGQGIPPESQAHIFERFYRADKARARSEEENGSGAGLGLSIAQWIAELHGGQVRLVSSDQRGSAFAIDLPIQDEAALR